MKRLIKVLLVFMLAFAFIIPVQGIDTQAASVKLSKTKATMEKDSVLTLKVTGASSKVTWSTSDKKVATVTKKGKVSAVKEGKATITAKVGSSKYECVVTVVDNNKKGSSSYNISFPQEGKETTISYGSGSTLYCETKISKISYEIKDEKLNFSFVAERTNNFDYEWSWLEFYYAVQDSEGINLKEYKYSKTATPGTKMKISESINLSKLGINKGDTIYVVFIDKGYIPKNKDVDKDKQQTIKITLPSVPQTLSNSDSADKLLCQFTVKDISYESSGTSATLYFAVEKTYDKNGDGQGRQCYIGWTLYDSEGYIVESGDAYSDSLKVGDKQKKIKEYISGLDKNETYRLEIVSVNGI